MDGYKLLIWDFRGPEAEAIADHYRIHLEQYVERNALKETEATVETVTSMYAVASLKLKACDVDRVEQELRPHRSEVI